MSKYKKIDPGTLYFLKGLVKEAQSNYKIGETEKVNKKNRLALKKIKGLEIKSNELGEELQKLVYENEIKTKNEEEEFKKLKEEMERKIQDRKNSNNEKER